MIACRVLMVIAAVNGLGRASYLGQRYGGN